MTKPSGFAITLYAAGSNKAQAAAWRAWLETQLWVHQLEAAKLPWFKFDSLVIGKSYAFTGDSLTDFMNAVREALQRDWQQMEVSWVELAGPPTVTPSTKQLP